MKKCTLLILALCFFLCPFSLCADSSGYVPVSGGKIYYETFGKGPPIIAIHGGPGFDHGWFLPFMKTLATDHTVVLYDQRGSGKSTAGKIDDTTITVPQFVADLDALRQKLGYDTVVLLGHSWGGLLAMNYALAHPQAVSALILADSAPTNGTAFQAFEAEAHKRLAPLEDTLKPIEDSQAFKAGDPEVSAHFFQTLFQAYFVNPENIKKLDLHRTTASLQGGAKVSALLGKYLENYDIREGLKTLKIPTLILHGDKDIMPLWTAQETQKTLPDARLVVIKDADHFSYVEKPDDFFGAIKALGQLEK